MGLRHIGWEKCGHDLTSRPRESSSELFLDELLGLFRYPPGSGRAFLPGTLPLRNCAARFACKTPTWRLPVSGHVARLVANYCEAAGGNGSEVSSSGVHWVGGSGPGRKRIRLNRQTPAHLVGLLFILVHAFGRGCVMWAFQVFPCLITQGGVVIKLVRGQLLLNTGPG